MWGHCLRSFLFEAHTQLLILLPCRGTLALKLNYECDCAIAKTPLSNFYCHRVFVRALHLKHSHTHTRLV